MTMAQTAFGNSGLLIRRFLTSVSCFSAGDSSKTIRSLPYLYRYYTAKRNMSGGMISNDDLKFLDDVYQLIKEEEVIKGVDRTTKVVDFKHPKELLEIMDFDISSEGASQEKVLNGIRKAIKYSVKTGHRGFFNQLYSGKDTYGLAGALVTEALNTNQHTFEVAPVFILSEYYMINKLCSIIGFQNGDGVFAPGGSMGLVYALHLARYRRFPETKKKGLFSHQKLVLFSSEEAHYSSWKAASFLGFGTDNVVSLKTDEFGRIIPADFKSKIEECKAEGSVPLMLVATSGTTVLGGYDPLDQLADICKDHGIWMHVDAAWGGGVLLSENHRHLMKGVEKADSLLWNLHKMLGTPLQCSAVLVNHKGLLQECFSYKASYLFQPDKFYDVSFDTGDKTVQCGRKSDAFKLWVMWKAHGDDGMRAIVDKAFDNARYLEGKMRRTEGFRLVLPQFECTNVCFWYIPPSLRNQEETEEWWQKIAQVSSKIKELMIMDGTMMIGYQPLAHKGLVNFFRIIIENAILEHSDMDFVVDEIQRLGKDL